MSRVAHAAERDAASHAWMAKLHGGQPHIATARDVASSKDRTASGKDVGHPCVNRAIPPQELAVVDSFTPVRKVCGIGRLFYIEQRPLQIGEIACI
jgi:hypothetical protein